MDGNAKLTHATIGGSVNSVQWALTNALERGKTIKPDQVYPYVIEMLSLVAIHANWIQVNPFDGPPDGPYAMMGGIPVPEDVYDAFLSLIWTAEDDQMVEEWMDEMESDPDDPMHFDRGPNRGNRNPGQWLIAIKKELGVSSWDQFRLMASKHLKELEAQQLKAGILVARTSGKITRDDIFNLLKGDNIYLTKVRAIAIFLNAELATSPLRPPDGWSFKDFIWPKAARRRGRPPDGWSFKDFIWPKAARRRGRPPK